MAEEVVGINSTSGEEVTQGSLRSSGTTQNRDTPLSKNELSVGRVRNDVLAKTSEGDSLETETESYFSQVKVFYFTFVLFQ